MNIFQNEYLTLEINLGNPNAVNKELLVGLHMTKCFIEELYYENEDDESEENITVQKYSGTRLSIGLFIFNIVIVLKNEELDEFNV